MKRVNNHFLVSFKIFFSWFVNFSYAFSHSSFTICLHILFSIRTLLSTYLFSIREPLLCSLFFSFSAFIVISFHKFSSIFFLSFSVSGSNSYFLCYCYHCFLEQFHSNCPIFSLSTCCVPNPLNSSFRASSFSFHDCNFFIISSFLFHSF